MNVYQRFEDGTYYVRYWAPDPKSGKNRRWLRNTGQTDKSKALAIGKKLSAAAQEGRWAAVDETKMRQRETGATLGQIVEAYKKGAEGVLSAVTVKGNVAALARILATVHGEKFKWKEASSAVLTPKLLLDYQVAKLTSAGADQKAVMSARTSVNANFRMAKTIFAKRQMHSYVGLELPDLVPFKSVMSLPVSRQSYKPPTSELEALTMKAAFYGYEQEGVKIPSLKDSDPAAYIVFLLAGALGMRPKEIGHARWSWIVPHNSLHRMNIYTDTDFAPKGRDDRSLLIEATVHAELMEFKTAAITQLKGPDYILPGTMTERTSTVFRRFADWMKKLGWKTQKKAHELRKLFGSEVARKHGLFAAQKLLGHKDPKVTSEYYAGLLDLPETTFAAGMLGKAEV